MGDSRKYPYLHHRWLLERCLIQSCRSWRRWQSVFSLFINFVYNVIVVFCRCLCRRLWLLCWRCCLRCAKRCSLLHGCLLCCASRWILIGILQCSFNGKSSSVRICKHLLCLKFCMVKKKPFKSILGYFRPRKYNSWGRKWVSGVGFLSHQYWTRKHLFSGSKFNSWGRKWFSYRGSGFCVPRNRPRNLNYDLQFISYQRPRSFISVWTGPLFLLSQHHAHIARNPSYYSISVYFGNVISCKLIWDAAPQDKNSQSTKSDNSVTFPSILSSEIVTYINAMGLFVKGCKC